MNSRPGFRSFLTLVVVFLWCAALVAVEAVQRGGWTIPATAATEKNPLTVNDAVIAGGKKLFQSKCQRCHGPKGLGDGEDADPEHKDDMNLTDPSRAKVNADGVVFYKIWNGRTSPKMPAFSQELTKEQVWAIVSYVQTLRHAQ